MQKDIKSKVNRREFLKGVGLAGSGALISLIGAHQSHVVSAAPLESVQKGMGDPPVLADSFMLEVPNRTMTEIFDSVSDLGSSSEIIEYQNGNDLTLRKRPGRTKYHNIVLERVITSNTTLWDWHDEIRQGIWTRYDGSIYALDDTGTPIARWNFFVSFPSEIYAVLSREGTVPYTPLMRERLLLVIEYLEQVDVE